MTCQPPNSRMIKVPTNSQETIAFKPNGKLNRFEVVGHPKRLLLLTWLAIQFLVLALTGVAVGQTTSTTDNGIPSGLAQGSPSQELDYVSNYNGHLTVRVPLLSIRGRSAGVSLNLVRNSSHWVVQKVQDRNHITYNPKADLNGKGLRLPFYDPARLYLQNSTNSGALCLNFNNGFPATTLRRFILITSDGDEHELRDQSYDGQPLTYTFSTGNGAARGTIFRSSDGSDLTFISDTPIFDVCSNGRSETGTGYLLFPNGTRYRFVDGLLQTIRDRNGDTLTFTYGTNVSDQRTYRRLTQVVDSINRSVTIAYSDVGIVDPPVLLYDQITYKGFGGTQRSIKVWYSDLGQALRSGYTLQTYNCLFPGLNSTWVCGGSGGNNTIYTASVASKVELPNGDVYRLYYNPYRELARLETPTGAAIEYDYSPQNPNYTTVKTITRRVAERRVFVNANDASPALRQVYSSTTTVDQSVTPFVFTTTSLIEYRNPTNLLGSEQHLFHGAGDSKTLIGVPPTYKAWDEGLEFQINVFDSNGTLLRSVQSTWQQRAHVSWWPQPNTQDSQANEPTQDPRIAQTDIVLADANLQSRKTFVYSNDAHNNVADVYEYDYGIGAPGPLVRRTHTDYLTVNPVNGVSYANPTNGSTYTLSDPHLRSLPTQTSIYDAAGIERARVTIEYDNYANDGAHAALADCPSISGLDPSFNTSYQTRGNVTKTTRWLLSTSTAFNSYRQYDIAGNILKAIDPRGNATLSEYADRFGSPDTEARSNAAPAELTGNTSYAFLTKSTNPLNHISFVQYDYYIGRPVNTEDVNGNVSSYTFNDPLDRPTQIRRAAGSSITTQSSFTYNDVNNIITVTSDLNTANDNLLVRTVLYDGLGRTTETRQYEGGTNYIVTQQQYDSLGRIFKVSNPYRPWQSESAAWTTTAFDALGRVASVTTPDNAVVTRVYSGNTTTMTDQAGKLRRTVTDALARLIRADEPDANNNLDVGGTPVQPTTYTYDVLDNLTGITQGAQTRTFVYDSMNRLASGTNPEGGATTYLYDNNGNLTSKVDARNITTAFVYDALNRVTSRSYSDGTPTVTYTYDAISVSNSKGRVTSVSSSVSATNYISYDAMGRVLGASQVTDGQTYSMSYSYNLAGAPISFTYPSGRVISLEYDPAARLAGVRDQQSGLYYAGATSSDSTNRIKYAAHGAVSVMKLGNNLWEHTDFNNRLQASLIGLGTSSTDSSTIRLTYNYGTTNNNDNVQSVSYLGGGLSYTQTFGYDQLNRLTTATESGTSWSQTNKYDRYGNRAIDLGGGNQSLTFNTANRITNAGYTYDAVGNLTNDSVRSFGFDADNKIKTVNGVTDVYRYDGDGNRVRKNFASGEKVRMVYSADQLIAEYDLTTGFLTKEYIYGAKGLVATIEPGAGTKYTTVDHLGSPRVVTNSTAGVVSRHDYMPFGEEVGSGVGGRTTLMGFSVADGLRQKFTAQERDGETQLDLFRSRYYASIQGRFTSADSFGGNPSAPQTLNRYAYAGNNPLRYRDPSGHAAQDTHEGQDPSQRPTGIAPPCWPNCPLLPGHLPVITETVTIYAPVETTDVPILTELELITGQPNPLPQKGATEGLMGWLLGSRSGNMMMGTAAVGTAESGGTVGLAVGAAVGTALTATAVYDIGHTIINAIPDAVPTTPDDEPPNTIILYRGLNGTNPGAFRVDPDGVSVFEIPPPGYQYILPIQAQYVGLKVPGTIANVIEPGLTGGIAVYTPQLGGPFHWSLNFPGKSAQDIKNILSQFAKGKITK